MATLILIILVLPFLLLPPLLLYTNLTTLWLTTRRAQSTLPISPTSLSRADLTLLFLLILYKSALSSVGLIPALQPSPGSKQTPSDSKQTSPEDKRTSPDTKRTSPDTKQTSPDSSPTFLLPTLSISAPLSAPAGSPQTYLLAASLPLPTETRAHRHTHPTLLPAALSTPFLLLLLASRRCPIKPLGAVHVRNRFEFVNPAACAEMHRARDLMVTGRMGGPGAEGRKVRRGVEFDVCLEIEGTWEGKRGVVFRQVVTVLQRLGGGGRPVFVEEVGGGKGEGLGQGKMKTVGEMRVPASAPGSWARLCSDYNPIHVSSTAARVFGFAGRIAHGNHVVAAVLEMFGRDELLAETVGGEELRGWLGGRESWWLEVNFRRPMVLPMKLEVRGRRAESDGGGCEVVWDVVRGGKEFVEGRMGSLR